VVARKARRLQEDATFQFIDPFEVAVTRYSDMLVCRMELYQTTGWVVDTINVEDHRTKRNIVMHCGADELTSTDNKIMN